MNISQNIDPVKKIKKSKMYRSWVWLQIGVHIICGASTLCFIFPFLNRYQKDLKIQVWSRRLLKIFNLKLVVHGADLLPSSPYLLVSNHISWLDIHVINAFKPVRFVAKSEVASWPIFGWMALQLGTVFIQRDSARQARQVVEQMAVVLHSESICIFPEGTSTAGEQVLPFKPNLFESALSSQSPAYPMAIQYLSLATGLRSEAPAFIGDMGLLESMSNMVNTPNLYAQITILSHFESINLASPDRKQLATYCQEAIARVIEKQPS
ncbi:1-acyl-sn-glycerol-3-phosphate acyltransferase [Polynucleobacter antarcticus]